MLVARGNIAWKFERRCLKTDTGFVSISLLCWTARLSVSAEQVWLVWGQRAHIHSRAEHGLALYRTASHIAAEENLSKQIFG